MLARLLGIIIVFSLTVCGVERAQAASANLTAQAYNLTVDATNKIRMGRPADALLSLQQAVAICPESWDVNFNIGLALEELSRYSEALLWYKKAYSIDPTRRTAMLGMGRIYYDQKNYAVAIPVLEQVVKDFQGTDVSYSVYLTLARAYAETGKIAEFKQMMDKALAITSNDPSAWRFAGQEMDYLKQYDEASNYYREYLKRFPTAPDAATIASRLDVVNYDELEIEELKEVQAGFKLSSDTDDLKDFVTVLDPKHTGVSNEAIARVMLGLSFIPRSYRQALESAGYKVVIAPTVLDAMPQLKGQLPRGYTGGDWHNANGTFDRLNKRIVIGEEISAPNQGGKLIEGPIDQVVQHEFGHAYDLYLGRKTFGQNSQDQFPEISHSKKFTDAYELDSKSVPAAMRPKLAYYLQSGDAGKEELFAQMFVVFFGHRPEPGSPQELFPVAFPRVLQVLEDARKQDPDYVRASAIYDARLKENMLTPAQRVKELLDK